MLSGLNEPAVKDSCKQAIWEKLSDLFKNTGAEIILQEGFLSLTIGQEYFIEKATITSDIARIPLYEFNSKRHIATIELSKKLTALNAIKSINVSHDTFLIDVASGETPLECIIWQKYVIRICAEYLKFRESNLDHLA